MLNLEDFKEFRDDCYARHLVLKTQNMEILVVCWLPGQETPIHGHGPTDGVVTILEGVMHNTSYLPDGKQVTSTHQKGDIIHSPVGIKHKMVNQSDQKCVTLHFYAPPLGEEFLNPDLGYSNDITVNEIQLPNEVIRYIMACPSGQDQTSGQNYSI